MRYELLRFRDRNGPKQAISHDPHSAKRKWEVTSLPEQNGKCYQGFLRFRTHRRSTGTSDWNQTRKMRPGYQGLSPEEGRLATLPGRNYNILLHLRDPWPRNGSQAQVMVYTTLMLRKPAPKPDDAEQSKRFIETAKEIGADDERTLSRALEAIRERPSHPNPAPKSSRGNRSTDE